MGAEGSMLEVRNLEVRASLDVVRCGGQSPRAGVGGEVQGEGRAGGRDTASTDLRRFSSAPPSASVICLVNS